MVKPPKTVEELFVFYHEYVKYIYCNVQINNTLPLETLFELNAAFDHLSRHWTFKEPEEEAVHKAYSHLKRSCLDIFKLKVRDTTDKYKELRRIDTSIIDNGEFDHRLNGLYHEIQKEGTNARQFEGQTNRDDHDGNIHAFDRWAPVYEKCLKLENDFYLHKSIEWAKKKSSRKQIRQIIISFLVGVVSSTVANIFFLDQIKSFFKSLWTKFMALI